MIIKLTIPGLADSLVGSLENKVNELSSEIVELNKDYSEQIENLNSIITDQESTINNLNSKINDLDGQIENLNQNIGELNNNIDELNTTISEYLAEGTKFAYSDFSNGIPERYMDYINKLSNLDYLFYGVNFGESVINLNIPSLAVSLIKMLPYAKALGLRINGNNKTVTGNYLCGHTDADLIYLTDMTISFMSDLELGLFPYSKVRYINLDNIHFVGNTKNMFYGCTNLSKLDINVDAFINVGSFSDYIFYEVNNLEIIPPLNTSNSDNFYHFITYAKNLKRIEMLDFSSCTTSSMNWAGLNNCRYILIKNIGKEQRFVVWDISRSHYIAPNWGINSDEVPDARLSLIDTFITYSFDRAANNFLSCSILFLQVTKEIFTDEEIALITAKGYTIA